MQRLRFLQYLLTGSAGAALGYQAKGSDMAGFTGVQQYVSGLVESRPFGVYTPQMFGAKGDGVADDTNAVRDALAAAAADAGTLQFPLGTYAIRNISLTGTSAERKTVRLVGDGAVLQRLASDASTQTDLLTFKWCDVVLKDLHLDHARPSGMTSSTKACVNVYKARRLLISGCTFEQGQYHGVVANACDNVRIVNNSAQDCYYDAIGLGGGLESTADPGDKPYGTNRVVVQGNVVQNCWGGIIAQVYCYEVNISGNVLTGGSIQIGQGTNRLIIKGNVIEGSSSYGYGATLPTVDGIFCEDPLDFVISDNIVRSVTGKGIYCTGSELSTTPAGPQNGPIPLQRGQITGNEIYQPASECILVTGRATNTGFVGSPTPDGDHISVRGNLCIGGSVSISLNTVQQGAVKGNECFGANTHAILIAGCTHTHVSGNTLVDPSGAGVGSYNGIQIEQGSTFTEIGPNVVKDTRGGSARLRFGVYDAVLDGGVASMTRYSPDLLVYGSTAAKVFPVPGVPALGTWEQGDFLPVFARSEAGTAGSKYVVVGYDCVAGGAPGTWVARRALTGN